ncbi:cytochrome P450 71A1-like [Selaginella moellendorffii]|uniref:cytochrome P450 71A1-like n=1 Tax=Selaginella moellendorffii TaxID=88036 RepID=UPI000D1C4D6C|nr:cytochrome P450 71A1-like [Selaginella moellendorffii]|eukprot:XP_024522178.1 cytochrome P450 71A1-like [Selaginella moellendorffii]
MLEMILTIVLTLGLILVVLLCTNKRNQSFPPSPRALPIIGHIHLVGKKLPHEYLFRLAKQHGGLMYLQLGRIKTLVASTPAAAEEVLKTHDRAFASRPANSAAKYFGYDATDLVWAPYGDHWRHLRKICTLEFFITKRVQMFQPVRKLEMSMLITELVEACNQRRPVDMTSRFFQFAFNTMSRMVLNKSISDASGSESEKLKEFLNNLNEASKVGNGLQIGDLIPCLSWADPKVFRIKWLQTQLVNYLGEQLQEHKKNRESHDEVKDFMDVLIAGGVLDDTRIKALTSDMLAAGTDAIAVTIDWALAELMRNPELMQEVKQELEEVVGSKGTVEEEHIPKLEFLQAIVKETLRLHPPAPLLAPHESVESCNIWGYNIPAGTGLLVNAYALGRDESTWSEANKFNPKRFLETKSDVQVTGQNFELIPFGSGRRMCPALSMGLTMVHYALATMLHTFEWSLPDGKDEVNMKAYFGIVLIREEPLMLVPRLAKSCP